MGELTLFDKVWIMWESELTLTALTLSRMAWKTSRSVSLSLSLLARCCSLCTESLIWKDIDLTVELIRRGYTDSDLRKILQENIIRVFREAEEVAASMQAHDERDL
jgi:hypothetical protein